MAEQEDTKQPPTERKPLEEKKDDESWQCLMGQDLVMKILERQQPSSSSTITEISVQDVVQIRLTGRHAPTRDDCINNIHNGPVFHATDSYWLEIGAHDVVPAVEMAVRFMSVGDTAVVWSHSKYAYGLAGRTHRTMDDKGNQVMYELPPESNVAYTITVLKKIQDSAVDEPETLLQLAQARKVQANEAYVCEWSGGAGKTRIQQAYQRIAKDMEGLLMSEQHNDSEKDEDTALSQSIIEKANALRVDALNNITAVLLRAGDYHAAKAAAVAVLEAEPHNFKGLVRAAKAALLDPSSEFLEVQAALEAATAEAKTDDDHEQVRQLTQQFTRRKQSYDQASKQMFQKALKGKNKPNNPKVTKKEHDPAPASCAKEDDGNHTEQRQTSTPLSSEPEATTNTTETKEESPPPRSTTEEESSDGRSWFFRSVLPLVLQFLFALITWYYLQFKRAKTVDDEESSTRPPLTVDDGVAPEF